MVGKNRVIGQNLKNPEKFPPKISRKSWNIFNPFDDPIPLPHRHGCRRRRDDRFRRSQKSVLFKNHFFHFGCRLLLIQTRPPTRSGD